MALTPRTIVSGAMVVAVLGAVLATTRASEVTFNVTADSDHIHFVTGQTRVLVWPLTGAIMHTSVGEQRKLEGAIRIAPGIDVTVDRIGFGPLIVRMVSMDGRPSVGSLRSDEDEPLGDAPATLELTFADIATRAPKGETMLLPISGQMAVGRILGTVGDRYVGILRAGSVAALSKSSINGSLYRAGDVVLNIGDYVRTVDPVSESFGFISVSEKAAMSAAYRIIANGAEITRPGGQSFVFGISPVERLKSDPALQLLWASVVFLVGALKKTLPYLEDLRPGFKQLSLPFVVAWLIVAPTADAQDVFLNATESAQGMLRTRGRECVVVTVRHTRGLQAGTEVVAANERRVRAELQRDWPPDIAILRLLDDSIACDQDTWSPDVDAALRTATAATLRIRQEDGSRELIPVSIRNIDNEYVTVRPIDAGDTFLKSMSGAALLVQGSVVGMLVDVADREARALRIDLVERTVDTFIRPQGEFSLFVADSQLRSAPAIYMQHLRNVPSASILVAVDGVRVARVPWDSWVAAGGVSVARLSAGRHRIVVMFVTDSPSAQSEVASCEFVVAGQPRPLRLTGLGVSGFTPCGVDDQL